MGILTHLGNIFANALAPMQPAAYSAGLAAFGILAVLTIVWSGLKIILGSEPEGITALARRLFFLALVFSVVVFGRQIVSVGINTPQSIASSLQTSAGITPVVFSQPSTAIETMFAVTKAAGDKVGKLSGWTILKMALPQLLAMVVLWLVQLVFALTLLRHLIEAHVLAVLVPVLLGFAGAPLTVGVAEGALNYLAGFAVRLLALLLVVGMTPAVADSMLDFIVDTSLETWSQAFAVAATGVAFAATAMGLPALVGRGMANIRIPLGDLLR